MTYILTENVLQLVSSFFASVTAYLFIKSMMMTTNHLQASRKVGSFKRTIRTYLQLYAIEHQIYSDLYIHQITCSKDPINTSISLHDNILFSTVLSATTPRYTNSGQSNS